MPEIVPNKIQWPNMVKKYLGSEYDTFPFADVNDTFSQTVMLLPSAICWMLSLFIVVLSMAIECLACCGLGQPVSTWQGDMGWTNIH
jgi:hypothetical protein